MVYLYYCKYSISIQYVTVPIEDIYDAAMHSEGSCDTTHSKGINTMAEDFVDI